jgi:deazaflavin-dependent oxidoreductase (nitroreductase family)
VTISSGSVFKLALRVHGALYERTDGRIGHGLLGVPTLMLRTTGRRSGETRTNSLVYARDGSSYLVVPSKGGADQPPGWFHNIRAQPQVEIQLGRDRHPATATVIEPDDPQFARLWKAVNDNNGARYDEYQARTTRPIPVVMLTPDAGALPPA